MTTSEPVIVVDIIGEAVSNFGTGLKPRYSGLRPKYTYGRQVHILTYLQALNNSITQKDNKYPLIAVFQDFPEGRGKSGYYGIVTIPKIVIACLTDSNSDVPTRYNETFKPILYPIYYEFLKQIARSKYIIESDADMIEHTKWDRVGSQPTGTDQQEYIDVIEINNLKITISQILNC